MLSKSTYISLLSSLHWGQLLKLKWFYEKTLECQLYLAPFSKEAVLPDSFSQTDAETLFTMYFQDGQQNLIPGGKDPLVEVYNLQDGKYIPLHRLIPEMQLSIPTFKELRKVNPFHKFLIEV